jgi:hypothetical protein
VSALVLAGRLGQRVSDREWLVDSSRVENVSSSSQSRISFPTRAKEAETQSSGPLLFAGGRGSLRCVRAQVP